MNIQDRYDELDNIAGTLDSLIDEIRDKDYIVDLQEIKYRAQADMELLEPLLQEEWEEEKRYANYEYERSKL